MAEIDGSSSDPLRTADLLGLARQWEPNVTERALESWRYKGLLPHPHRLRGGGRAPVWAYPSHAGPQLTTLMRLRTQTRDEDELRAGLWLAGFPIDPESVINAFQRVLHTSLAALEKEIAKAEQAGLDRDTAIESLGRTTARKRGGRRLLRQRTDVHLADREAAFGTLLCLGLGDASIVKELDNRASTIERIIGLDRARTFRPAGVEPWLSGPAVDGFLGFLEFGSLPKLVESLASATVEELFAARPQAQSLLTGIEAFCRLADALLGRRNVSGMGALADLAQDPTAGAFVTMFVVAARRTPELAPGLEQVCAALDQFLPIGAQFQEWAALSVDERAASLPGLASMKWSEQRGIERALEAFTRTDTPPPNVNCEAPSE